jgi:hypothetical protein
MKSDGNDLPKAVFRKTGLPPTAFFTKAATIFMPLQ